MSWMRAALFCCLWGGAVQGIEQVDIAPGPEACTQIESRLERLACFDRLFGTPVSASSTPDHSRTEEIPHEYRMAQASEARRQSGVGFIAGHDDDATRKLWLTAPAIGSLPPRPVLMLSCIDDISRVELMLPEKLDGGWVQLKLGNQAGKSETQRWMSDDSGHVLRSGRGLPAIRAMKAMLGGETIELVASNEKINGLRFDGLDLARQLAPLRKQCRW